MESSVRISVTKLLEFSAAHAVLGEELHGHNYKVALTVSGPLTEDQVVMDFRELKRIAEEVIGELDHRNLNELMPEPTAERIALTIWNSLERKLKSRGVTLERVTLWENDRSWVEIRRDR